MWALYLPWDVVFTELGIWGFNNDYLIGWRLFHLPLEEWLFFLLITYACAFIYESVVCLAPKWNPSAFVQGIFKVLSVILLVIAVVNHERLYTFVTFLLCGGYLFLHAYYWQKPYLGRFFVSYGFMLIPFLIVNGALTGAFTAEPVVWYNDHENLGLRIYTIPIEDSIYLLLMMLMVIDVYEYKLNRQ